MLVADNISSEIKYTDNKQTVFVEFNKSVSKSELQKIQGVQAVRQFEHGWLIEATELVDLRLKIAEFAQQNGILPLTLKLEAKSMEEYFKGLTKN